MKKILVSGGCGYVGHRLVPRLLQAGYHVVVYDIMFFGEDNFGKQPILNGAEIQQLTVIRGDIRDTAAFAEACQNVDVVLHLACISNDPSFELNPTLGRSINYDAFIPLVKLSKKKGIRRFIFA